jgi:CheY-like chemotaxis protein
MASTALRGQGRILLLEARTSITDAISYLESLENLIENSNGSAPGPDSPRRSRSNDQGVNEDPELEPAASVRPEHRGDAETILLAEDDDGVREFVALSLATQGYRVLQAASGAEAIMLAQNHQDPIQILITDVVMPVVDGCHLAHLLRPSRPEMKVLFVSGHSRQTVTGYGVKLDEVEFLPKPCTPAALVRKVRQVLDRR